MKDQLLHHESKFKIQKKPIVLLLDRVSDEANIGGIFRLADAFNIEKILFGEYQPNLNSNRLKRTARKTFQYIDYDFIQSCFTTVKAYEKEGYKIYALEITGDSVPIDSISFRQNEKVLLIVGNEQTGISKDNLDLSHTRLHISMFGINSSMNVAQATGIALYEISKTLYSLNKK